MARFQCLEAVTRGVLWYKVFLEMSQSSQENTCARASFLVKIQASGTFSMYKVGLSPFKKNVSYLLQ